MQKILKNMGYKTVDSDYYDKIKSWLSWYMGKSDEFHKYYQYNGIRRIKRERASLAMAKKVCEDWANLLLNEQVSIATANEAATQALQGILDRNNFRVFGNRLVELTFALGTGAFVEYKRHNEVVIDYIRAEMIFPLSWENGNITECAFAGEVAINGNKAIYVQVHTLEGGKYIVRNKFYDKKTEREIPAPEDISPEVKGDASCPLFQIITPNIVNNMDLTCPMGVSVFAGAIDILKGVDLVYDSYCNEYRLGKKRIILPASMVQIHSSDMGIKPMFDDNDTEFYAAPGEPGSGPKEINMEIRSAAHREGLQENLAILSDKCGLGNDRYTYGQNGVKTATEVVSEKSALFQNLKKHELVLDSALKGLVRALLYLSGHPYDIDVMIDFDDSIIEDKTAQRVESRADVALGLMAKWEYRAKFYNESEAQARKMIGEAYDGAYEE